MSKRRNRHPVFDHRDPLLDGAAVDSLDLHGFSVREAEARVSQFIPGIAKTHPGAIVEIVTGRGRHSREEPVLRDVVKSLLKGRLSKHVREFALSVDGGAYRVQLN